MKLAETQEEIHEEALRIRNQSARRVELLGKLFEKETLFERVCGFAERSLIYLKRKIERRTIHMLGYCMKCKEKREMGEVKYITMKNGKPASQGVCTVCGTKMFKIGKATTTEKIKEALDGD